MAKLKSRRIGKEETDGEIYCRKCMENKLPTEFYDSPDKLLDSNGKMSICKNCINSIFNGFMISTNSSLSESVNKTCRILNVYYSDKALDSTKTHLETLGDKAMTTNIFSIYKSHLGKFLKLNPAIMGTYEFDGTYIRPTDEDVLVNETAEYKEELYKFWGKGLQWDEYQYLESELAEWKKSHKHDTHAELVLLREIVFTQLAIKKEREQSGEASNASIKKLQEIMKTSSLDPANSSAISGAQETFGNWIKEIESMTPAEWWEDNKLFEDMDDLKTYWTNYVTRPIKNFVTGSRDFNINEGVEEDEEDVTELDMSSILSEPEDEEGVSNGNNI